MVMEYSGYTTFRLFEVTEINNSESELRIKATAGLKVQSVIL